MDYFYDYIGLNSFADINCCGICPPIQELFGGRVPRFPGDLCEHVRMLVEVWVYDDGTSEVPGGQEAVGSPGQELRQGRGESQGASICGFVQSVLRVVQYFILQLCCHQLHSIFPEGTTHLENVYSHA